MQASGLRSQGAKLNVRYVRRVRQGCIGQFLPLPFGTELVTGKVRQAR